VMAEGTLAVYRKYILKNKKGILTCDG